jgi:hypothetical protein
MAYLEKRGHSRVYKCDGCGKVSGWEKGWMYFGNILLDEACPLDLPTVCRDDCAKTVDKKLKNGIMKLPKITRDYQPRVRQKRKGY